MLVTVYANQPGLDGLTGDALTEKKMKYNYCGCPDGIAGMTKELNFPDTMRGFSIKDNRKI